MKNKNTEPPDLIAEKRSTDFWLDMHLSENMQKRAAFVLDYVCGVDFEDWLIDAMIMLCETFRSAAEREHGALTVVDIADEFQRELFKYTKAFETGADAYRKYLRKGARDYHFGKQDEEQNKLLTHMAEYFAQEPNRLAELREKFDPPLRKAEASDAA